MLQDLYTLQKRCFPIFLFDMFRHISMNFPWNSPYCLKLSNDFLWFSMNFPLNECFPMVCQRFPMKFLHLHDQGCNWQIQDGQGALTGHLIPNKHCGFVLYGFYMGFLWLYSPKTIVLYGFIWFLDVSFVGFRTNKHVVFIELLNRFVGKLMIKHVIWDGTIFRQTQIL